MTTCARPPVYACTRRVLVDSSSHPLTRPVSSLASSVSDPSIESTSTTRKLISPGYGDHWAQNPPSSPRNCRGVAWLRSRLSPDGNSTGMMALMNRAVRRSIAQSGGWEQGPGAGSVVLERRLVQVRLEDREVEAKLARGKWAWSGPLE